MLKKVLTATLILLSILSFSVATFAYSESVVASLDSENITVETLNDYVKDVAGKKYETLLNDKEGLRKLADFYINRSLLLEHARKSVKKNDTVVTNHNVRSVDADVMYLTALLKIEVQDKVNISKENVLAYMKKSGTVSEKKARQELESVSKNRLMDDLIEQVRIGHKIQYFN
jgi:hypothetical protein